MVSSRAKTPSGAAEAIPMPTEMDSRVVETVRMDGGDGRRHDDRNGQNGGDSEPSGEGLKKGSASEHCLSGWGKSTCP